MTDLKESARADDDAAHAYSPDGAEYASTDASHADESIKESVERLIASGQELISAEVEWARLKAGFVAIGLRNAAFFAVLAALIFLGGLTTLLFGIILALAQHVGAIAATLIVAITTLAISALLIWLSRRSLRRVLRSGQS